MKAHIANAWEKLRTSYWVLPLFMVFSAIGGAHSLVLLDTAVSVDELQSVPWVWIGSPDAARGILSTVASSMITVAGVTFSITMVAVAQAATQYGPRLLRNFMRDVGNQVVLGTFVATFIYCLVVLRTVHESQERYFVPHISVTVGIVLATVGLAVLIYFIHHMCDSLQAENLVAQVGVELQERIAATFSEERCPRGPEESSPEIPREERHYINAPQSGYVQAIEKTPLMKIAREEDLFFVAQTNPGDFIAAGSAVLIYRRSEALAPDRAEALAKTFLIGRHRTPTQDVDYSVHQLAEIALRALSPGVNDPYTAVSCVDWMGAALIQSARLSPPSPVRRDEDGRPRLYLPGPSFRHMLKASLTRVRQQAADNVAIAIRLLETLTRVMSALPEGATSHREAVSVEAMNVHGEAMRAMRNEADRLEVDKRYEDLLASARSG